MRNKKTVFVIALLGIFSIGSRLDNGAVYSSIINPENMYLYDTILLVSDSVAGIHVYSVKNGSAPAFRMRIPLRGNNGVAMKGDVIYANSYGSIVTIRLTGPSTYEVSSYIKGTPTYAMNEGTGLGCDPFGSPPAPVEAGSSGSGGSYAVFAVIDSYLYYLDGSNVVTLDISNPQSPQQLSQTHVDWSAETLFPTRKYLFVGGESGMYVLDRSNPSNLSEIGTVSHFRAYDPVVVSDTVAFVSLRMGSDPKVVQDEVLSVSLGSMANPYIISELSLTTPYGLAVSDSLLYVAQGYNGFALYNVKDPRQMTAVASWTTPSVKDFIWAGNRLYVMTFGEIMIYDVTNPSAPALLSTIR
jgi:hypothetical protein